MPPLFRKTTLLPYLVLLVALLLSGCRSNHGPERPSAAFAPYVPAFTSGHISARSPVLVKIAEGLALKDTSHAALQDLFTLSPSTDGSVNWQDDHTLAFVPAKRLRQNTQYTVSFHLGKLTEVPKNLEDFNFSFTTFGQQIDLHVEDLSSISPKDLTWQRVVVGVFTSDDANGQDLEGSVKAVQDGRPLKMTWEHEPNGTLHRAVADSVLRGTKASAVEFTWDAGHIGGQGSGSQVFQVPAVGDFSLISSSANSEGDQNATLLFSDPLDPAQDLSGLAGIAGADNVRIAVIGNKLMLYPAQRLTGSQNAFVAAGLKNINGHALGMDLSVDLLFEEVKPNVRTVGNGTILPSTDGLLFPFEAVNLNAVDVRIVRIYEANIPQFLQVNNLDGDRELARTGRLVLKRTIPLDAKEAARPGAWNRYYLDLDKLIKAQPGAIYRVIIGFRQAYSTYPCEKPPAAAPLLEQGPEPTDEAQWDEPDQYYYDSDYNEDYDDGDYNWNDREDPCTASYFRDKGNALQRNLLASDLGLIAKRANDGTLLIAASNLRTTEPMKGVDVKVLDLQQRAMATVSTGRDGLATVPSTAHKPFLLVASKGNQRSYLKLDDGSALSVSNFDVGGEEVDKGLKGFLYGERGVWRPGDSLYLTFILQKAQQALPKDIPVTLELSDPQGRLDQRMVRTSSVEGTYSFHCATQADAPTGVWGARVKVGGTSFYKPLRIETVKPNRLKIQLDLGGAKRFAGEGDPVQLQGNWLHGAPAGGLKARVTATLTRSTAVFDGYGKYTFNDLRNELSSEEIPLFDGTLDAKGHTAFPFKLAMNANAPAAVRANVVTRIFEPGGDASMDRADLLYLPYTSYAGVLPAAPSSDWGGYFTDTTYSFGAVALTPVGKPIAGHRLNVQVVKLGANWWWSGNMDEPSNYMTAPSTRVVHEAEVTTDAQGKARFNFRVDRPLWGRFIVRLSDPASGHVAATELYVDWPGYGGRSRRENGKAAAMLTFNTDKEKYAVGDHCELTIPSSGKGRALVSLEGGSRILQANWIDLNAQETKYSFTITKDMVPNIYAHVTLVQPHALTAPADSTAGTQGNDLPIRLYGVVPILVEDAATHLSPVIGSAAEFKTDQPFTVEVAEKDGKAMTYTLAIVDEGLLDLTRFKTPDPWGYFLAREALGVRTWDLYDQVIGAFGQRLRRVLALGGSDQANPAAAAKAQRFKPVVRFAGPFVLAKGAKAKHIFTISNYVGSVRVMVVANAPSRAYGNAEKAVPVRKALMLLATLPRVAGPGETVDLPVTVFAMDPKVKNVRLNLAANDLFSVVGGPDQALTFTKTGEQTVTFRVKLNEGIGVGKVTLTAEGAGEKATQSIEINVRQASQPETNATDAVVQPGATWEDAPEALGLAGTNEAYLELSTLQPLDLGRRLQYLIDYPHGCLEQTTSKAFPQLYIASVMDIGDAAQDEMRRNVQAGLGNLKRFQTASGGFAYWPGNRDADDWTSTYAGHFLVEAERKGFTAPPGVKDAWLAFTRKQARDWAPGEHDTWSSASNELAQAYRLYVLALNNTAEAGAMNRLRTTPGISSQSSWMLAAAYALNNRKDVARELAKHLTTGVQPYRDLGWTYGSGLRDQAVIAEALMRMDDMATAAGVVRDISAKLGSGEWYSTQSTAWALLAVSRFAAGQALDKTMHFTAVVNGKTDNRVSDRAIVRLDLPAPNGQRKVSIANMGKNLIYVRLVRTGIPMAGKETPASQGLAMDVSFQTMDGKTLDPTKLGQGTDFQAVVTVRNPGTRGYYRELALTQVFPSGWEIRNSRLEGTDSAIMNGPFNYQDIRDDRVLTYFNLPAGEAVTYRVLLNAAYAGRFHLPGTSCSAMYDNTINARSGGQWVEVVQPGRE